jgi:hypothetical protein
MICNIYYITMETKKPPSLVVALSIRSTPASSEQTGVFNAACIVYHSPTKRQCPCREAEACEEEMGSLQAPTQVSLIAASVENDRAGSRQPSGLIFLIHGLNHYLYYTTKEVRRVCQFIKM